MVATAALESYLLHGGQLTRPMIHDLMQVYVAKGRSSEAMALLHEMPRHGLSPNEYSFSFALSALKRSLIQFPDPDPAENQRRARKALDLINDMRRLGLPIERLVYNEAMDCVGKVGLMQEAFALFNQSMEGPAAPPTQFTFSILIKACVVAGDAEKAEYVVEKLMPSLGVQVGSVAYNGLLAAHAGNIDRAYAVWQRMVSAGIVPDAHTERALASSFASNPQLAVELVSEARAMQCAAKSRATTTDEGTKRDGIHARDGGEDDDAVSVANLGTPAPSRQSPLVLDDMAARGQGYSTMGLGLAAGAASVQDAEGLNEGEQGPFQAATRLLHIDLHGHSQAAAKMVLLRRLDALMESWPHLQQAHTDAEESKNVALVIVTGRGRSNPRKVGVLREVVTAALAEQGLRAQDTPGNPGRLQVPLTELAPFITARRESMQRDVFLGAARARFVYIGTGLAWLAAAAFIIPRLAPWL